MKLRTLLVSTGIAISALGQEKDFLRPGAVITPEQVRSLQRNMQRNIAEQQWSATTARRTSRCSVPLKNLAPATATSKMPTITPDDQTRFTIKSVPPPAPPCEPNERQ